MWRAKTPKMLGSPEGNSPGKERQGTAGVAQPCPKNVLHITPGDACMHACMHARTGALSSPGGSKADKLLPCQLGGALTVPAGPSQALTDWSSPSPSAQYSGCAMSAASAGICSNSWCCARYPLRCLPTPGPRGCKLLPHNADLVVLYLYPI